MKLFRTLAALLTSVLLFTACQSHDTQHDSRTQNGQKTQQPANEGKVTFTHPTVEDYTIEFDKQPQVIVMDYYTAAAMASYGIKPAAVYGYGKDDSYITDAVDLEGVPTVGQDGEINLEQLAEIKPDVIMGHGTKEGWTWFKEDVNAKLLKIAPFIGLKYKSTSIDENIMQARKVAEFLGGDTTSDAVKKADQKWEKAKEDLKKAASGKNLSMILLSPMKETIYTAVGFAQAQLFEDAGISVLGPERPKEGNPWGKVAWEELSTYPADIYAYEEITNFTDLSSPLWKGSKPVQNNQVFEWNSKMPYTTAAYGDWLTKVSEKIAGYKKVS